MAQISSTVLPSLQAMHWAVSAMQHMVSGNFTGQPTKSEYLGMAQISSTVLPSLQAMHSAVSALQHMVFGNFTGQPTKPEYLGMAQISSTVLPSLQAMHSAVRALQHILSAFTVHVDNTVSSTMMASLADARVMLMLSASSLLCLFSLGL
jgi:hypothetical protein